MKRKTDYILITWTSMFARCLTCEVFMRRQEEKKKRIEFSQQTNSFCVTLSNESE